MDVGAALVVTAAIFVWGVVAARLERADLTAPIVFVALGAGLAATGLVSDSTVPDALLPLVEVTLVWVLFSDAARVPIAALRPDLGRCVRLLGIGLPLTMLAGWGLATWMFPDMPFWHAVLLGTALAPTDAALGVPVVTNPAVPSRVRRLITVESGLNDGIATPVVMLAVAGAASAGAADGSSWGGALVEIAIGGLVGAAVGAGGGWLLRWSRDRAWTAEEFAGVAVLALALAAYTASLALQGNGFVAAFCGGLAFGAVAGRRGPEELHFLEQAGSLVSLLVWLAFGAIASPIILGRPETVGVLYAVLSLTLVRMVPVALACLGTGLSFDAVLFIGWFGPRGLASLVFALLALEELGPAADHVVAVIGVTVFLSVLAHGFTSRPLAVRYGRAAASRGPEPGGPVADLPVRAFPSGRTARKG